MKLLDHSGPVISLSGIHKHFGALHVLTGIDLTFKAGEITAIVGPNGAGKSTLIKCVLGLVKPSTGSIEVAGKSVEGQVAYRSQVGYMPQAPAFPDNLTGREIIALISAIRNQDSTVDRTLERTFEMEGELDKPVSTLSGGTRQKLSAILAFMFEPGLYILDEPTAGLDPVASSALKDHILSVRDKGGAVILTSHVMADLEELCDRVVFLIGGRIRFDGTLEAIRSQTGELRLERAIAHLLRREVA